MKILAILLLALAGCATSPSMESREAGLLADSMRPHRSVPAASLSGPLGSATNPVRVLMPEGEREYLHRLRCPNGGPPEFERLGSTDLSPYGRIMDMYSVRCLADEEEVVVYMDMYHCMEETAPLPDFEIVPELGIRAKEECR